jgi:mono/diheme cytochrome c family protein
MSGKTPCALLLCAALLCAAAPAPGGQGVFERTARRGADDALEHGVPTAVPAAATPAQAQPEAGDPKAKALFESKCSACHALSRPLGKNKDRDGWTKTVTRMQKVNGCDITDAEAKAIVDYLVAVRGPAGK